MPETRILMEYKRHAELVDGKHPYTGRISVHTNHEESTPYEFVGLQFHEMMTEASRRLRKHPDAPVIMHRTERRPKLIA